MEVKFEVEEVEIEEDTIKEFRDFTNKVVGRGLQIPDNNLVFFGYRISHNGKITCSTSHCSSLNSVITPLLANLSFNISKVREGRLYVTLISNNHAHLDWDKEKVCCKHGVIIL